MVTNPFSPPRADEHRLEAVYHFFVDKTGKETGEHEVIGLTPDGKADLSGMKDQRRAATWEAMGVATRAGLEQVYPKDGEKFLRTLLDMNNQIWRFRRHA